MSAVRVPWSSASFLVYAGGLTILFALVALLSIAAGDHGAGGLVLWSLLVFVLVSVLAFGAKRTGHAVTAGVLALSSLATFVVVLGALLDRFGWFPSTDHVFEGFRFWLLVLELATLVAAAVALRLFRFPAFVFIVAAAAWFFVTDLISGGGDWTAIVTIGVGLALLAAAVSVDHGSRIYAFWLHVAAGLAIGGGLLWFFHDGDFDWIVIGVAALLYIALGDRLLRSSWIVLATWGLLQVTTHFAEKWADLGVVTFFPLGIVFFPFFGYDEFEEGKHHAWAAGLAYALLGAVLIGIGLLIARRRRASIPAAEML
jgi:uncharacterized membrane-anchored protein YitT (DUF2179 family)